MSTIEWKDWPTVSKTKVGMVHITVRHRSDGFLVLTTGSYWEHPIDAKTMDEAKPKAIALVRAALLETAAALTSSPLPAAPGKAVPHL